jgi:hypothetical protein
MARNGSEMIGKFKRNPHQIIIAMLVIIKNTQKIIHSESCEQRAAQPDQQLNQPVLIS